MEELSVEFVFNDEDPEVVATAMQEQGATEVEALAEGGILPLVGVIVVGIIALSGLINVLLKLIRVWKCGAIVDARGQTVHIEKNCDLPRGSVLVLGADGSRSMLHEPSEIKIHELITAVLSGMG